MAVSFSWWMVAGATLDEQEKKLISWTIISRTDTMG